MNLGPHLRHGPAHQPPSVSCESLGKGSPGPAGQCLSCASTARAALLHRAPGSRSQQLPPTLHSGSLRHRGAWGGESARLQPGLPAPGPFFLIFFACSDSPRRLATPRLPVRRRDRPDSPRRHPAAGLRAQAEPGLLPRGGAARGPRPCGRPSAARAAERSGPPPGQGDPLVRSATASASPETASERAGAGDPAPASAAGSLPAARRPPLRPLRAARHCARRPRPRLPRASWSAGTRGSGGGPARQASERRRRRRSPALPIPQEKRCGETPAARARQAGGRGRRSAPPGSAAEPGGTDH